MSDAAQQKDAKALVDRMKLNLADRRKDMLKLKAMIKLGTDLGLEDSGTKELADIVISMLDDAQSKIGKLPDLMTKLAAKRKA